MADKLKVDPEEFLIWREHPITRLVLSHFRERRQQTLDLTKDQLFLALTLPPEQWACQQPEMAFARGQCDGLDALDSLTADEINGPEDGQ